MDKDVREAVHPLLDVRVGQGFRSAEKAGLVAVALLHPAVEKRGDAVQAIWVPELGAGIEEIGPELPRRQAVPSQGVEVGGGSRLRSRQAFLPTVPGTALSRLAPLGTLSLKGRGLAHQLAGDARDTAILRPGGAVDEERRGVDGGGHLRQRRLRELEVGERRAEQAAGTGAVQGFVEGAAGKAEGGGADGGAEQ